MDAREDSARDTGLLSNPCHLSWQALLQGSLYGRGLFSLRLGLFLLCATVNNNYCFDMSSLFFVFKTFT